MAAASRVKGGEFLEMRLQIPVGLHAPVYAIMKVCCCPLIPWLIKSPKLKPAQCTHPSSSQGVCSADDLGVEHTCAPELTGHESSQGESNKQAGDDEASSIGAQTDAVDCGGCEADTQADTKAGTVGICGMARQAGVAEWWTSQLGG